MLISPPAQWPEHKVGFRVIGSLIGVLAFAAMSAAVGVVAAVDGDVAPLKYCLVVAVLFLLVAAYGTITQIRSQHRVADILSSADGGRPATVLRYGLAQFGLLVTIMSLISVAFLGAIVDSYVSSGYSGIPSESVVYAVLALYFGSFPLAVVLHRLRRGEVILSEDGIRQAGWSFCSFLPWGSILGAEAAYDGWRMILVYGRKEMTWDRKYTVFHWKMEQLPPVPMIQFDCRKFAIDSVVLYHFVMFYRDNPQVRGELGTNVAIERARSLTELGYHPERGPSL